jgi:SAM-dependent methyltransferase
LSDERYYEGNRLAWDERAPVHAASPGYHRQQFIDDPEFLSHVVRFDVPRLGDIRGLRGVHLQCHIGTDTISLQRLGARMTGLDLSPASLQEARALAAELGEEIEFVEANVYDAREALGGRTFDFVYTGVGALCWLPSIVRWAQVVSQLLESGGRLFVREGHPMLWTLDYERDDDLLVVAFPYFEHAEPSVEESDKTYVETDAVLTRVKTYNWNHGLGEIVTALLDAGLELTGLVEHDSAPWEAIPGRMEHVEGDEWRHPQHPEWLPQTYTLQAVKRS